MSILFWILLAIGLAVVEIVSVTFFPIFFAASAVLAAILQAAGVDPLYQWAMFGLGGLAFSGLLRPVAQRQLERGPTLQSEVESLRGKVAVVTVEIDGRDGTGAVSVDGDTWSAKPAGNGLAQIGVGLDVEIQEVRGATLIVAPLGTIKLVK